MSASSNTLGTMWRGIQHVAFLAFCASVPAVGFGQPATLKKPDHTAVAREVAAVRGAYKKEIAAANKDQSAATELVHTLLSKLGDTPDAEGKWALIDVAQEIAVDASANVDAALTCVARRASLFDVDAAKERLAVLKELSKPRTPANAALHGKAMQAAREALAAERYAEATEAATIAADVAKALYNEEKDKAPKEAKGKKKPPVLAAHNRYVLPATQVRKRIKEAEGLSDAKTAALVTLEGAPGDVAAKASLGEYKCFVKADWTEGLPLIALSPEPALAAVATAELEAREAVDNSRLLDVADSWWDLAERSLKGSELKRDAIKHHAVELYACVLPGLAKHVDQKRAKDRMAELGRSLPQAQPRAAAPVKEIAAVYVANRAAAEWALGLKAEVSIEPLGKERETVVDSRKLPSGPFVVVAINLPPNAGMNPNDLAMLKPLEKLEGLGFGGNPITDEAFDHVGDLPNLKGIGVNWTGVSGAGLARLRNARLVGVDVGGVQNIMPALERFKAMGTLESINFDRVDIPQAGFAIIAEMTTLKQLWFRKDFVSEDSLNFLKQKLPSCTIILHE